MAVAVGDLTHHEYNAVPEYDMLRSIHHWLPVQWCIKFKLASLTSKVMLTGTPLYLSCLLIPCCPSCVLRSSSSNLLQVPCSSLIFGSCSFCAAAPSIWNSLLTHSVHLIHSTLSCGTSKHTKQLSILPSGMLQCDSLM